MVPVKVAKLKVELREAEDDLVKALAGMSSSKIFLMNVSTAVGFILQLNEFLRETDNDYD